MPSASRVHKAWPNLDAWKPLRLEHPMARTTQGPVLCLDQSCLTVQNLQGLLQASDLSCAARGARLICLRLLDACRFDLGKVFRHCIQLCLHTVAIRRQLSRSFVQCLRLLVLVLNRLLLGSPVDLILIGRCLVSRDCCLLICSDLGQVLGEICLYDLQKRDDATRRTISSLMRCI